MNNYKQNNAIVLSMDFINQFHIQIWIALGILPVISLIILLQQLANAKKHKQLIAYYSKFISTRQATNDLIEVIIYNIYNCKNFFIHARDIVKSFQKSPDNQQQSLDQAVNDFNNLSIQLDKDNKMSVDRSYTNDIPKHAPSDSPFKSIWFWLPVLVSYSLLLFVNYKYNGANNGIMLAVFFVVILLEIIILYFTLNNFNRIKRLKQYTEDQLLTIINLLDIRRIFVKDSAQKLTQQYNQLRTYEQLCNSIPQAKEYLKGLEILKRNIAVLEQTYRVSDINVATPLIAVGSLLQKAVKEKYNPEAKSQNLKFINNIQPGLSLYISQEKLSLLIDPLIQNAINSSQPDQSVTIKGIPKSNKIELEIIDQGNSITEKDLPSIFRFDPKHITTPEAGYISLSLRLARLIVSTLGGEIKVSSSQKAGTIIKLIIPKTRGQNIITTTPKISKVTTPLS